ncbi:Fc receptor-like protein 4 [Salvelinus alpinus]|uniref:Fc receptor-like protein 4 n=1 Tax=Salvelinus alpinus TaxID=8036 RepID=UPI0039FC1022
MGHTLLCLLLLLSTHIYSGHSEDDGKAKAVLTIYPTSSQIFSGESVTLRCNIQRGEVTDWESLPTASVKASPRGPLYSGERVTLQCDISDNRVWTYCWHRDNHLLPILTSKTTTISPPVQAGQYQCEGTRTRRPERTYLSSSLTIVVAALPKATLTITPNPADTGERVTLTCSVGSDSGWRYTWYKDNTKKVVTSSGRHTTTGAPFTISRAAESDQGLYWCQGEIQSRSISSIISDPVTITVKERPVAVLTLQPNWPQIFRGETVTLSCDIQGGEEIVYVFYNSGRSVSTKTEPEYRISPAKNGLYTCEGLQKTNGLKHSQTSNAIQLTVLDKPQAVLSVSPQWLNPGDSVTLSCGVKESSTGWRFIWYRTVPYTAGLLSLSDTSYSVEPLSGNGTSEDSYTLIPAGPSHTGGYVCRAGRGDPVYDTLYSEPQFLWSGDSQPSVSLKTRPNRTQHFTSKSLSLSCEEKRNSTGWRLKRYRENAVESGCVSNWGSIAGSTCTIRSTHTNDSGVYWCESGSGEYSNAVNITVDVGPLILENPPYPITEGESMTLSCTKRYQETNPNPKVNFYKDGIFIRNETTLEMTIPAVSKSDEGFYKCKSNEGESPESWVTVRGSIVSISVLPRLLCGLLVASPFLLVSIVLMVKCCRARGLCSTAKSLQYELPSDDVIKQTESSV